MNRIGMKRFAVSLAPALVASLGLLAVSSPAHADQKSYPNHPNCVWQTGVLKQHGNDLQVTAYAWGQANDSGNCDGTVTPEYSVQLDAYLDYKDSPNGQERLCKAFTFSPDGHPYSFIYNTTPFFGLYFATIPGGGLLSSGDAGLIVPFNQLCGPGYYSVHMNSCVDEGGWGYCGPLVLPWQYMNIPRP
jgi:hypothetical protein